MAQPKRFLIVPEADLDGDVFLRAQATADSSRQEAGIGVQQPTASATTAVAGDIRPLLTGTPEVHVEGTMRIANAGPTDRGRWAWVREDDDASFDLQFRQCCRVFGRRPDLLRYDDTGSGTPYSCRPKMLSLKSGRALLGFLKTSDLPAYAGFGGSAVITTSLLDPDTDTWSDPAEISAEGFGLAATRLLQGVDFVQFPDTGEVLMLTLWQDAASPTARRLYVHHARDEASWDGTTWTQRMSLSVATVNTRFAIRTSGDSSSFAGCAAELLAGHRILLAVATFDALWSFVSDDRGTTWTATKIADHDSAHIDGGQNVSCCRMRNGVVMIVATCRLSNSDRPTCKLYLTTDGTRFGTEQDLTGGTYALGVLDVTVVMRPDGWPQIYGTAHSLGTTVSAYYDALVCMSGVERDPRIPNSTTPSSYFDTTGGFYLMHVAEGGGDGAYRTDPTAVEYKGFVDVEAIAHRGQILLATQAVRQSGTPASPVFETAALMVYRTAHWQPLREALENAAGEPVSSARGRIYNRTWEPYGVPQDWGFSVLGAGSESIEAAGAEGGYLEVNTSAAARNYGDTTLPTSGGGLDGAIRFVLQVVSGGSQSTDDAAVKLYLDDGAGNGNGFHIRASRDVAVTKIGMYDGVTLNLIGSEISVDNDEWIEVVASIAGGNATMMVRSYDRTNDPDWDGPYQQTGGSVTSGTLTDLLAFGTFATSTTKTRWKTLQLHRPAAFATSPLTRKSTTFVDDQNDGTVAPGRSSVIDDGIDNYMRCSQITSDPAQYMCRGVHAGWRGEATTEGNYANTCRYDYAAGLALEGGASREWRSVDDNKAIEIVLDAGASGRPFRPDAVALFGLNCPDVTVQLDDADSGWAAPALSYRVAYPGAAGTVNRYGHLWAFAATTGWSYAIDNYRLTVDGPGTAGPWRPHQFYSQATGPRFYCAFSTSGGVKVYRIVDNTHDTLVFATDPVGEINVNADTWSIHSDRVAAHIGPAYVDQHEVGYRYCRILLRQVNHMDTDEDFYRLGRIVLGRLADLSSPDFEWGWGVEQEAGYGRVDSPYGATFTKRRHSPRRVFQCDYGFRRAPKEADAVYRSPVETETRESWAHTLDLVRRMEGVGKVGALLWDGDRAFTESTETASQVAADPHTLMLCRIEAMGSLSHVAFQCQEMNLPTGSDVVPRPMAEVRRIVFREEL